MKESRMPKTEYINTEYGYQAVHDYGNQVKSTDTVLVPPHDPEAAARTRREINAVLARYGYRLADREEGASRSNER